MVFILRIYLMVQLSQCLQKWPIKYHVKPPVGTGTGQAGLDMYTVFFHFLPCPSPTWKWNHKVACVHQTLKSGPSTARGRLFYSCLLGMNPMVGLSWALSSFWPSALGGPSLSQHISTPE